MTSDGERVDELVRRVKEGASAASAEAIASGAHSRPKGTADLAADAAVKGRYRQLPITGSPRSSLAKRPRSRWWGARRRARRRTRGDRAGGRQTVGGPGRSDCGFDSGAIGASRGRNQDLWRSRAHDDHGNRPCDQSPSGARKCASSAGAPAASGAPAAHAIADTVRRHTQAPFGDWARPLDFAGLPWHRYNQRHAQLAPRLATTSEAHSNTPPATGVSTSESTTSHNSLNDGHRPPCRTDGIEPARRDRLRSPSKAANAGPERNPDARASTASPNPVSYL